MQCIVTFMQHLYYFYLRHTAYSECWKHSNISKRQVHISSGKFSLYWKSWLKSSRIWSKNATQQVHKCKNLDKLALVLHDLWVKFRVETQKMSNSDQMLGSLVTPLFNFLPRYILKYKKSGIYTRVSCNGKGSLMSCNLQNHKVERQLLVFSSVAAIRLTKGQSYFDYYNTVTRISGA